MQGIEFYPLKTNLKSNNQCGRFVHCVLIGMNWNPWQKKSPCIHRSLHDHIAPFPPVAKKGRKQKELHGQLQFLLPTQYIPPVFNLSAEKNITKEWQDSRSLQIE
jgi:hypothetical protein